MGKIKDMLDSPEMEEFRKVWKEQQERYKEEATELWNTLSYDDSLKLFYYVVSKIHEGDVEKRFSYRGVLYEIFGFDMDSYAIGMDAKYLDLHNIIYDGCDYGEFKFAKKVILKCEEGETVVEFPDSRYLEFSFDKETDTLTITKEESLKF